MTAPVIVPVIESLDLTEFEAEFAPTLSGAAASSSSLETVLSVRDVSKTYPNGTRALRNVSFEVRRGEFVVIIGPSGAGKSTLMRSLNRLVEVTEGVIDVEGQDLTRASGRKLRAVRRRVAMVFQHANLVGRLTVLQNVLHGRIGHMSTLRGMFGRYPEADKRTAVELLQEIDLGEHMYNRASELSGGQKQRVGIARAIIQDPAVLLCDEPIASLDPSVSKVIMDMIYQMTAERGITTIVNLHQIDVALRYATRIIGMHKGEIVFDGTPSELTRETIELIYDTSLEELMIAEEFAK
ncbi:MAG: phosphonate ABC transporter ATP-binding protein [Promicromonosporaceae bacterium]|nr:phosphonate ABC transporter ATP-binding protein [Promicromonosporaceae bacterium]